MKAIGKHADARGGYRKLALAVLTAGLLAGAGCSTLDIESLPAPDIDMAGRTTFRIVERPPVREVAFTRFETEVMLNNEIIDRMVRYDVQRAFESRGYVMAEDDPDFLVAFYTRAEDVIEIDDFRYDGYYPYRYRNCCYIDEFTEGMVVIDVIDPKTDRLLWRASGVARVSDDPKKYARQLREAVFEILEEFPVARPAYGPTDRREERRQPRDYGEDI